MNHDYLEEFLPDLDEFRQKLMAFDRKELTVAEYKGFSGGFGSYAQRGGERHMLRLRLPGGVLSKEKLSFILSVCKKHQIDLIKFTTCQSLQLHNLKAEALSEIIEGAWRAGMISRGGGGDFPRNVMATPLSGIRSEEPFDVQPYAKAAGDYLMHFIKAVKFPRKLKVCFSNNPENEVHATFRDLGFIANENHTFTVYAAGGLGNNPSLGIPVAKDIAPDKILYCIKAMVDTFTTYGNYENRGRSRTRYLKDTLGVEGLQKAYQEMLSRALAENELDLTISETPVKKQGDGTVIEHPRITPQKQDGLYAVYYHPIAGHPSMETLTAISDAIAPMEEVELRLTPDSGVYIINLTGGEAEKLLTLTKDGANTLFETSICCIGAATCQVGLGNSPALLKSCVEAVRKENFADGVLPRIKISGCPSSCGAHQVGDMGFRGAMKPTPDGPKPAFAIFVGGSQLQTHEQLATMGKSITVEDIPRFLVELGHLIAVQNTTYSVWIKENSHKLMELIEKYS